MDKNSNPVKMQVIIVLIITLACVIMAFIDAVLSPDYFVKSSVKLIIFLVLPLLLLSRQKEISLKSIFKIEWRKLVLPILFGLGVYLFILGAYFTIGTFFDFSKVTSELTSTYGVEKQNFLWVALYISLINSFLEEFFFRGIGFLTLKKYSKGRFAYVFSALAFSIYHVFIMSGWFNIFLFILLIASLFVAGLLFNWLNEKRGTIYTSWLVHMCANFATNTIGLILFDII